MKVINEAKFKIDPSRSFECVRWSARFEMLPILNGNITVFLVANRYTPLPINQDYIFTYETYYWYNNSIVSK